MASGPQLEQAVHVVLGVPNPFVVGAAVQRHGGSYSQRGDGILGAKVPVGVHAQVAGLERSLEAEEWLVFQPPLLLH